MKNTVIITGAGSGIGRALAINLSQKNIPVLAVGRRLNMLEETSNLSKTNHIQPNNSDISKVEERTAINEFAKGIKLSGLVHCAGIFPIQSLTDISLETWQHAFATNVDARLFLSQAFAPILGTEGRILFIGSMSATTPRKGTTAYCASKAASFMVQECLKKEIGATGPAVGSAVPGPVKSHILDIGMEANFDVFPDGKGYKNSPQIDPERLGRFLSWLLLNTSRDEYSKNQWDIRHEEHHDNWLNGDQLYI